MSPRGYAFRPSGFERLEPRVVLSLAPLPMPVLPASPLPTSPLPALLSEQFAGELHGTGRVSAADAGNSRAEALNLGVLSDARLVRGAVGRGDTSDFFRFRLEQAADLRVDLTDLRGDADLTLYDEAGRVLERSSRGGRAAEVVQRRLPAGTYYALVTPYLRASTTYQLRLAATKQLPPANAVPEQVAPEESAPGEVAPDEVAPTPAAVAYYGGPNEWNLNQIGAPAAWFEGATGSNVVVAVLDTGVDRTHADLTDNIWTNQGEIPGDNLDNDGNGWVDDVFGWNFAAGSNDTLDRNGHGTHVAGTIAASRNGWGATGVAPNAKIMPVTVLSDDGGGRTSTVAEGIRYAVSNGADIINLSLGGGFSSQVLAAVEYAWQQGVLIVAAAGNQGAAAPEYPARHSGQWDNVISVGAYDRYEQLAAFSNRVGTSGAVQLDAPGREIYSTVPGGGFAWYSGTSMATPHVAGVAALMLSASPDLTAGELRSALLAGAMSPVAGSDALGRLNAAASLERATSGPTAAGVSLTASGSGRDLRESSGLAVLPQRWEGLVVGRSGTSSPSGSAIGVVPAELRAGANQRAKPDVEIIVAERPWVGGPNRQLPHLKHGLPQRPAGLLDEAAGFQEESASLRPESGRLSLTGRSSGRCAGESVDLLLSLDLAWLAPEHGAWGWLDT